MALAVKNEFRDLKHIEEDKDLDSVRNHELYKYLIGLLKNNEIDEMNKINAEMLLKRYFDEEPDNTPNGKITPEKLGKLRKEIDKYIEDAIEKLRKKYYDQIDEMIEKLRKGKTKPAGAYFGIRADDLTESTRKFFKLPENEGVLVTSVTPKSPAEKGGIHPLDIILKINGKPVGTVEQLKKIIAFGVSLYNRYLTQRVNIDGLT